MQKTDSKRGPSLHALFRQSAAAAAAVAALVFSVPCFPQTAPLDSTREREKEWEREQERREKNREFDAELERKVRDALILNSNLFHSFLEISVKDRVATLSGRVLSDEEEEMARLTALGVVGVRNVKMKVEVRPLGPGDSEELKKLRGASSVEPWTPSTPPSKAKPKTLGPFPTGISTPAERMRDAQHQAQEDARIRREVEFAIQMEAGAPRARSIYVTVQDGVVTLTGVAESRNDRFDVENAARRIRGVKRVSNQMIVR